MSAVTGQIEVFYSYAHEDEPFRQELEKHLSLLKRQGVIAGWHDRHITAGAEWKGQIDQHLESAQIILLLISPDFMASDYCYDVEMTRALERHEQREARVIPVLLRYADWESAPFGKLQYLPRNRKPVKSWADQDEAFREIAKEIREVIQKAGPSQVLGVIRSHPPTRRWLLIGLCLVVLSVFGVGGWYGYSQWTAWQRQVEDYIAEGEARLDIGRYGKAKESFQQALTLDPDNVKAQWGREIASIEDERNPVIFEERIRRLHEKAPNDPHVNVLLGRWHAAHHEAKQAISNYQKAIEADPKLAEAYFGLGVLYDQRGDWETAKAMYEKALDRSEGTPKYRSNLAYLYAKHGLYPQALEEYRKLPEQFILASQEIAALYRLLGEPEEALGYQQKAVQSLEDETVFQREENQDPWYFELGSEGIELPSLAEKRYYAWYSLALNLYLLGRETQAEELLKKASQSTAIYESAMQELLVFDLKRLASAQPTLKDRLEDFQKRFLPSAARLGE
jgi:tetratricopeptide (TPR) repeat protein